MTIRAETIEGERAMQRAYEAALDLIEAENGLTRTYVATGLLMAALDHLTSDIDNAIACETVREALARLEAN